MHADNLIVEFIIAAGSGQECVTICDKHIKKVHNLKKKQKPIHRDHTMKTRRVLSVVCRCQFLMAYKNSMLNFQEFCELVA